MARRCCPPLPKHGGDRNRTSPFAFTGNKFEFRALGSSQSPSLPNTVLNTIVAEAIDEFADELEAALKGGPPVGDPLHEAVLEDALRPILQRSYAANKQIVFGGDNYDEEWHAEAEQRGLLNLRATPDALPYLISDETVGLFESHGVLSRRELESRHEVFLEQYVTKLNIEAETAASIARTHAAAGGGAPPRDAARGPARRAGRRDLGSDRRVHRGDQGPGVGQPGREPATRAHGRTPSTCATR